MLFRHFPLMAEDEAELHKRIFGDSDSDDDEEYQPGDADPEISTDRLQQILSSKPAPKQKRKRLQKKAAAPSRGEASGGAGASSEQPQGSYDDPDQDSLSGSEAMEDNTQNEVEGGSAVPGKRRKGAHIPTRDKMNEEIRVRTGGGVWACVGGGHR